MKLYNKIIEILKNENIEYKEFSHEPILSYEDAEKEKNNHNWEWVESKNVFMNDKKWNYYIFITIQWEKVDFKKMKEITWEKLRIASNEDVENVINCVPWCVAPFWFDSSIKTIVSSDVFNNNSYLFSPWITTKTIQLNPKDLKNIFENLENVIFILK